MTSSQPQLNRILVTGGAGFVGANLVRLLLDQNLSVTVLDNFSVGKREYLQGLDIEIVEGDILDSTLVNEIVAGHDGIVHLAAQTGVPGSIENPRRDCEVNIVGTLNFLEAARHNGIQRFVFASSNAPLGKQPPPATEDKAPLPLSPYGASKLAGEGYCLAYHGSWGLGTVILRFANLYGPYSAHKGSVVAKFFRDIATGQLTIDGNGTQTRDFIYVGDLCRAITFALDGKVSGEVFQIATGIETSIRTLAECIQQTTNTKAFVEFADFRVGDIRQNYSSIQKAKRLLNWEPQIPLQQGLALTWEWLQTNNQEKH